MRFSSTLLFAGCLLFAPALLAQASALPSFELQTRKLDVDVDGAPTAYGPPTKTTLDYLKNAHYRGRKHAEIVGYLTDDDDPRIPIVQGPHDPAPGYYISQTAFTDPARTRPADPLRYVDASRINYIVLGTAATRRGARLGDFVAVYSRRTHRSAFGILADDGNPSGNEGSLHLVQALGYDIRDGKEESVTHPDVLVRFYPHSNPQNLFFHSQQALDAAAEHLGLSRVFSPSDAANPRSH